MRELFFIICSSVLPREVKNLIRRRRSGRRNLTGFLVALRVTNADDVSIFL